MHRALAIGLLLLVTACSKGSSERPLFERIYGLDEIPTFEITLDDQARAALAKQPREYVHGGFAYKSTKFTDVAIRLKGHRSLRKLSDKPSFKIDLDRFGKHALAGQKMLTLNNLTEDPSMMREVLAYRLFRSLGVAAPAAGFAEVVVNGDLKGLYAVIESVDKRFLKQRFGDTSGPVYEGEWGCDIIPDDVAGFDQDTGPKDRVALGTFAQLAAGDAKALFGPASVLDVDAFLRFVAVDMYVGNFDGYRHGHNYRIYFEPTKQRWYFMPWGLDRTFVKDLTIYDSNGYLATRCFADASCRARYVKTMRDVVEQARKLHLETGVDVIGAVIADAAARDPHRASNALKKQRELRDFLVSRPADIEKELGCLDASGAEVDRDGDGFACLDCKDDNAAVHPGVDEVCDGIDNDCNGIVDDAGCACTETTIAGTAFALCNLPMPYADADKLCRSRGQTLARIDDEAQARAVHAAVRGVKKEKWWIGYDDRQTEGSYKWLAPGAAAEFSFWHRGEPDNSGCNQDCAVIDDADDAQWADTHCLEVHPFICR